MNQISQPLRYDIIALCALLATGIFLVDVYIPPRFAVAALYSLVIVLSLITGHLQTVRFFAWLCTGLLVIGHFGADSELLPVWLVLLNRALFLLVIWITAILGMRLIQMQIQLRQRESELKTMNQSLDLMAHHDSLTGVANRRYFNEELADECRRANRSQTPLSLLMIDVDHFKAYNDIQGHQAGDRCLIQIARSIEGAIRRPGDRVARYGGEEFAVILPTTSQDGAVERAEDIRRAVESMDLVHPDPKFNGPVTVSIGVCGIDPHVDIAEPTVLISAADAALYRAKESGRNCVRIASPRNVPK